MSKLSKFKKTTGLVSKEEEAKEDPPVTETLEDLVEKTPPVYSEEKSPEGTPTEETPESETPTEETPEKTKRESQEPNEEKPPSEEDSTDTPEKEAGGSKNKSKPKRSRSKDSQNDPKEEPKEEPKTDAPKRGRKPTGRKDRVIVMLDKDLIGILDSFSISRSSVARAVIRASRVLLISFEGEITEDELVNRIKASLS